MFRSIDAQTGECSVANKNRRFQQMWGHYVVEPVAWAIHGAMADAKFRADGHLVPLSRTDSSRRPERHRKVVED